MVADRPESRLPAEMGVGWGAWDAGGDGSGGWGREESVALLRLQLPQRLAAGRTSRGGLLFFHQPFPAAARPGPHSRGAPQDPPVHTG